MICIVCTTFPYSYLHLFVFSRRGTGPRSGGDSGRPEKLAGGDTKPRLRRTPSDGSASAQGSPKCLRGAFAELGKALWSSPSDAAIGVSRTGLGTGPVRPRERARDRRGRAGSPRAAAAPTLLPATASSFPEKTSARAAEDMT